MSIQNTFNQQAIDKLPGMKNIINNSTQFDRNQLINIALQEINRSSISLDDMTDKQLTNLANKIFDRYNFSRQHEDK